MTKLTSLLVLGMLAVGCAAPQAAGDDASASSSDDLRSDESVHAGATLTVGGDGVNLRQGPSTDDDVVTVLDDGEKVTVLTDSGSDGWVHVKTPQGEEGWVSNQYVDHPGAASKTTCDPTRAAGIVSAPQKALHDSIAYAEGTNSFSHDGYDVLFGFETVDTCKVHPSSCVDFGRSCSTAAGRYQFLTTTWDVCRRGLDLTSFEPENQERAGKYLINTIRRVSVPQSRAMTSSEFANAMSKLSYEWASLPPGRYGQPKKSMGDMHSVYCAFAGC